LVLYIVYNVSSRDIRHFLPDRVLMIMSKIMDFQDFAVLSNGMVQIQYLFIEASSQLTKVRAELVELDYKTAAVNPHWGI